MLGVSIAGVHAIHGRSPVAAKASTSMANPDYPYGAFTKAKTVTPGSVERKTKRLTKQAALDAAYEAVNQRDGWVCWVTGQHVSAGGIGREGVREHHHLKGRRVKPEWRENPHRIITVSGLAHDCITNGWIEVEGDDARKPIFFHWTADAPKKRPLIIKRQAPKAKKDAA
jgi:hypothetical protein